MTDKTGNRLIDDTVLEAWYPIPRDIELERDEDGLLRRKRKWSDGGGTGLVQWTGDLGPGLQVDITKVGAEK